MVNLVQFSGQSGETDVLLEGWTFDGQSVQLFDIAQTLRTNGSTNLNAGIDHAYRVALRTYDAAKTNRVVILTDAYANTGEVDPAVIARNIEINGMEGIYFSGLGIGDHFQEAFLNELTDIGRGAYFAAITPQDIKKAFDSRFTALLFLAAKEVRFRLDYPQNLALIATASEELSSNMYEVQPTNFSYNTSQYFLETFEVLNKTGLAGETLTLTISYTDASGVARTETLTRPFAQIEAIDEINVKRAIAIKALADLVARTMTCSGYRPLYDAILEDFIDPTAQEYVDLAREFCRLEQMPF